MVYRLIRLEGVQMEWFGRELNLSDWLRLFYLVGILLALCLIRWLDRNPYSEKTMTKHKGRCHSKPG